MFTLLMKIVQFSFKTAKRVILTGASGEIRSFMLCAGWDIRDSVNLLLDCGGWDLCCPDPCQYHWCHWSRSHWSSLYHSGLTWSSSDSSPASPASTSSSPSLISQSVSPDSSHTLCHITIVSPVYILSDMFVCESRLTLTDWAKNVWKSVSSVLRGEMSLKCWSFLGIIRTRLVLDNFVNFTENISDDNTGALYKRISIQEKNVSFREYTISSSWLSSQKTLETRLWQRKNCSCRSHCWCQHCLALIV